jgi:DNA-binding CsgD family transcriptional regulator
VERLAGDEVSLRPVMVVDGDTVLATPDQLSGASVTARILGEMAQGRNNASVGAALGLSERAVEKHINSVFSKLGLSEEPDVHRRVKAVLLYLADRPQVPGDA